ncbi:MAG: hypothetical protein JWQ49_112 [Edaphobacter sp.]|nr:hypothetical protein [Edaphobacter sp.]
MKKLLTSIACLLMAAGLHAQTTTYTGSIKDLALKPVTSGQVTFTLAPSTDSTLPGTGRFTPSTVTCSIKGDGTLAASGSGVGACVVTSNTALSPAGTSYRICIQPQFATPGSCFFDYATGGSKDISTVAPTLQTGPLNYNGVPGPPGCVLGTTCTSSLTPQSVGGVLYADQCSGTDIGMRINSCVALLPTASSGYKVGTIILPNTSLETSQIAWATTVHVGPGVSLLGQGQLASSFVCTVAGDCLLHDESASSGLYAHTVSVNSVFQGFTISGNNLTTQTIVHLKDAVNLTLRDVAVDGAGTAGSACILLHDVAYWTERNVFDNVSTLYGCKIGWRFIADTANPNQPNPSFGYNRFLNIKANPITGQIAFSLEGNSFVYNCTFRITVNADHATILHIQDNAKLYESELHMFGEGTGNITLDLGATTQLTYIGQIDVGPQVNSLAAGSVLIHWGDDGGFGPAIPTDFANGIRWAVAVPMASGTNLNTISTCGDFAGVSLVNAPAALGTQNVRVQVVCSANPGYLTQIAYQMEFTGSTPRVWQRTRDNGTWNAWREQAWVDQLPALPLTGLTGALPGTAIAAGACVNLTANITGATTNMAIVATPAHQSVMDAGLHWDTSFADNAGHVIVPVCNTTASPVTPSSTPTFNVRVIQ